MRTERWAPPSLANGRAVIVGTRGAQVLSGISRGLTNPAIGAELHLSEDTIKTHVKRLLKSFGAVNRAHLAALACSGQVPVLVRVDAWSA